MHKVNQTHERDQLIDAIKGFLIVCVVIGHSKYIGYSHKIIGPLIYSFHIPCFFFIPFIVGYENKSIYREIRNFLVPYCIFLIIYTALYSLFICRHIDESLFALIKALAYSNFYYVKKSCGFIAMWFLPAFFMMLQIKKIGSKMPRIMVYSVAIFFHIFSGFFETSLYFNVPFGLTAVAFLWFPGELCTDLWEYRNKINIRLVLLVLMGCIFYVLITNKKMNVSWMNVPSISDPLYLLIIDCFYLSILFALYHFFSLMKENSKFIMKFLINLGKNSKYLYLFHMIILFAIESYLSQFSCELPKEFYGVLSVVITIMLSLSMVFLLNKITGECTCFKSLKRRN